MDWQLIINLGATAVLATVGYFVRDNSAKQAATAAANQQTSRELTELRVKVAQDYVTHAALNDIKTTLIRIEGKLDLKADK